MTERYTDTALKSNYVNEKTKKEKRKKLKIITDDTNMYARTQRRDKTTNRHISNEYILMTKAKRDGRQKIIKK